MEVLEIILVTRAEVEVEAQVLEEAEGREV